MGKFGSVYVGVKSALGRLGVKEGSKPFKSIVEGGVKEEVPLEDRRCREDMVEDRKYIKRLRTRVLAHSLRSRRRFHYGAFHTSAPDQY
ncbi:hypothetical protein JAAARDRAFT_500807 [Jaapia argillacea MUCL 33604]|uniref:Uncharacterized protein n=1 Tax=Jaapia argillacea MUCL 33604 TaxID=933084 RepID=A0A067PA54_9AGAM|nr:hypothetical protein JAAARDRAFT_500807 [Jaapia argillacea MUCL 33604]